MSPRPAIPQAPPTPGETPPVSREWHTLSPAEVLRPLGVDRSGTRRRRSASAIRAGGPERRGRARRSALWRLVLAQSRSLVVLLLLAASVIAAALGEYVEALAILAVLLLNAGIGLFTEWRACISLAKLRTLPVPGPAARAAQGRPGSSPPAMRRPAGSVPSSTSRLRLGTLPPASPERLVRWSGALDDQMLVKF